MALQFMLTVHHPFDHVIGLIDMALEQVLGRSVDEEQTKASEHKTAAASKSTGSSSSSALPSISLDPESISSASTKLEDLQARALAACDASSTTDAPLLGSPAQLGLACLAVAASGHIDKDGVWVGASHAGAGTAAGSSSESDVSSEAVSWVRDVIDQQLGKGAFDGLCDVACASASAIQDGGGTAWVSDGAGDPAGAGTRTGTGTGTGTGAGASSHEGSASGIAGSRAEAGASADAGLSCASHAGATPSAADRVALGKTRILVPFVCYALAHSRE